MLLIQAGINLQPQTPQGIPGALRVRNCHEASRFGAGTVKSDRLGQPVGGKLGVGEYGGPVSAPDKRHAKRDQLRALPPIVRANTYDVIFFKTRRRLDRDLVEIGTVQKAVIS